MKREKRLISTAALVIAAAVTAALALAPGASAKKVGVTRFSSGNPGSTESQDLEMSFTTLVKGGKTKKIIAQPFTGFGSGSPAQFAAVGFSFDVYCSAFPSGFARVNYQSFIQIGPEGQGAIKVKKKRFNYQGTAFDGTNHEGQIAFQGQITHHGRVATGSVRVSGAVLHEAPPAIATSEVNCDTEPNGTLGTRGQPLTFSLVG